jgi:hypothetical protein
VGPSALKQSFGSKARQNLFLEPVQGRDANASWRAIYRVATALKIPFDVQFMWAQKEGLAYAGQNGRFLST